MDPAVLKALQKEDRVSSLSGMVARWDEGYVAAEDDGEVSVVGSDQALEDESDAVEEPCARAEDVI